MDTDSSSPSCHCSEPAVRYNVFVIMQSSQRVRSQDVCHQTLNIAWAMRLLLLRGGQDV